MLTTIKTILSTLNERTENAHTIQSFSDHDLKVIMSQARKLSYIAEGEILNRSMNKLIEKASTPSEIILRSK
jgi:hypothetical protein